MSQEFTSDISKVEDLYNEYEKIQYDDSKPLKTVRAFHNWYDAASVLFSECFENDDNYKKFCNVETDGNSYSLADVFNSIRSPYTILINKIKKDNVQSKKMEEIILDAEPYIFLSHASFDSGILQLFKTHILKAGLGFKDNQIGYTSDEASGVPAGKSIPTYIKEGIGKSQVVLLMISDAYKNSEVCLNEMGAAWALDKNPISVLLPNVNFDKLGWLTSLDKAIKIDDSGMLANLQEVICKKSKIQTPRIPSWNQCVKNFLEKITKNIDL